MELESFNDDKQLKAADALQPDVTPTSSPISDILGNILEAAHEDKRNKANSLRYLEFADAVRRARDSTLATRDTRKFLSSLSFAKSKLVIRQAEEGEHAAHNRGGCARPFTAVGNHTYLPDGLRSSRRFTESCVAYRVLEIECQYDANETAADFGGSEDIRVKPPTRDRTAPLAYLYRFYCTRSRSLLPPGGAPPDAPQRPPQFPGALPADNRAAAHLGPDPIMNLDELLVLLDDFRVVPERLRKADIRKLFRIVTAGRGCFDVERCPHPHPVDIRYPDFVQLMVRIGICAFSGHEEFNILCPSLPAKLRAFARLLRVDSTNTPPLRQVCDQHKRCRDDRNQRKVLKRTEHSVPAYVVGNFAQQLESWQRQMPDAGEPRPPRPRGGTEAPLPQPFWNPASTEPAPEALVQTLLDADIRSASVHTPRWHLFKSCGIDCGVVHPGDERHYRVVLRSRGWRTVALRCESEMPPWVDVTWNPSALRYGLPRVIHVNARFPLKLGEHTGELHVIVKEERQDGWQRHVVPFFASVVPRP